MTTEYATITLNADAIRAGQVKIVQSKNVHLIVMEMGCVKDLNQV